jgi:hypothetical protein
VSTPTAVLNRGYLWKVLALLIACQTIAYVDRVNWVFTIAILFAA